MQVDELVGLKMVDSFNEHHIDNIPMPNPIIILPASPRKIEAGGRLKKRNPRSDPDNAIARTALSGEPLCHESRAKPALTKQPTVVAIPSAPSIKFNALTAISSHRTVIG